MTEKEAGKVLAVALTGSAQRERSDEELRFLLTHLLPLPYERSLRAVREHVAGATSASCWITTPAELLDACGIPRGDVRRLVVRAAIEGGQVLPDLRAELGWSLVEPDRALPQGVVEARALAGETAPAQTAPSLPPPTDREQHLADLLHELRARRSAGEPS